MSIVKRENALLSPKRQLASNLDEILSINTSRTVEDDVDNKKTVSKHKTHDNLAVSKKEKIEKKAKPTSNEVYSSSFLNSVQNFSKNKETKNKIYRLNLQLPVEQVIDIKKFSHEHKIDHTKFINISITDFKKKDERTKNKIIANAISQKGEHIDEDRRTLYTYLYPENKDYMTSLSIQYDLTIPCIIRSIIKFNGF